MHFRVSFSLNANQLRPYSVWSYTLIHLIQQLILIWLTSQTKITYKIVLDKATKLLQSIFQCILGN